MNNCLSTVYEERISTRLYESSLKTSPSVGFNGENTSL